MGEGREASALRFFHCFISLSLTKCIKGEGHTFVALISYIISFHLGLPFNWLTVCLPREASTIPGGGGGLLGQVSTFAFQGPKHKGTPAKVKQQTLSFVCSTICLVPRYHSALTYIFLFFGSIAECVAHRDCYSLARGGFINSSVG